MGKNGKKPEIIELTMVRRDYHDYEVGSAEWVNVMIHNIVVSLMSLKPLNKGEMAFIVIQNEHLKKRRGQS